MLNHYNHERMAQIHRQDLLREAAYERQLGQLPQPRRRIPRISSIPLQLKLSWQALRMHLHQGF